MSGISINQTSQCVRVCHGKQQTYFSFADHGGEQGAMMKALEFERSLPAEIQLARYLPNQKASGASGVVGVHQYVSRGRHIGWVGSVSVGPVHDRRQLQQCFGFATYGNRAFDLAVKWRKAMLNQTLPTGK